MVKMNCKERRKELIKLIKEQGIWNLPSYRELGERFGVSYNQIFKDIKFIILNLPKEQLNEVFIDLYQTDLVLLEKVRKIAIDGDDKQRLQASETYIKLQEALTRLLENWGRKEKIADKLETTTRNYTINIKAPEPRKEFVLVANAQESKEEIEEKEDGERS